MSNQEYKLIFPDVCLALKLGEILNTPVPVSGGLMHKIFYIETTKGKYAIKLLNPQIMKRPIAMQNYINSENISQLLADDIPSLPALRVNDQVIHQIEEQYFLVFTWQDGSSLSQREITTAHCEIIGTLLSTIHRKNFSELHLTDENTENKEVTDWSNYVRLGIEKDLSWVEALNENVENLTFWNGCAIKASRTLSTNRVISHRDLDPKNVLWKNYNPTLIDWESAGFIHPLHDLIETALYWASDEFGETDEHKFHSFLNGYYQGENKPYTDWFRVLDLGYQGKLEWLEYNLRRSLGIESTDEEDQALGTLQVVPTLVEINNYSKNFRKLIVWLKTRKTLENRLSIPSS